MSDFASDWQQIERHTCIWFVLTRSFVCTMRECTVCVCTLIRGVNSLTYVGSVVQRTDDATCVCASTTQIFLFCPFVGKFSDDWIHLFIRKQLMKRMKIDLSLNLIFYFIKKKTWTVSIHCLVCCQSKVVKSIWFFCSEEWKNWWKKYYE